MNELECEPKANLPEECIGAEGCQTESRGNWEVHQAHFLSALSSNTATKYTAHTNPITL